MPGFGAGNSLAAVRAVDSGSPSLSGDTLGEYKAASGDQDLSEFQMRRKYFGTLPDGFPKNCSVPANLRWLARINDKSEVSPPVPSCCKTTLGLAFLMRLKSATTPPIQFGLTDDRDLRHISLSRRGRENLGAAVRKRIGAVLRCYALRRCPGTNTPAVRLRVSSDGTDTGHSLIHSREDLRFGSEYRGCEVPSTILDGILLVFFGVSAVHCL